MNTALLTSDLPRVHPWWPRLVAAELLKLRKRPALVLGASALTVGPMLVAFTALAVRHASDPDTYGPAGGLENLSTAVSMLTSLGAVAAVLVGVTAGAGDLTSGVFRDLVITGRSRLQLFAARIPAGLAVLLPTLAIAFAVPAIATVALAGSEPAPTTSLVARAGAVLALEVVLSFVLALGVASILGSRGTSIAVLLGWQLALAPALSAIQSLGPVHHVLPGTAIDRLVAHELGGEVSVSLTTAVLVILAWTVLPLAVGAWRMSTRDV